MEISGIQDKTWTCRIKNMEEMEREKEMLVAEITIKGFVRNTECGT